MNVAVLEMIENSLVLYHHVYSILLITFKLFLIDIFMIIIFKLFIINIFGLLSLLSLNEHLNLNSLTVLHALFRSRPL